MLDDAAIFQPVDLIGKGENPRVVRHNDGGPSLLTYQTPQQPHHFLAVLASSDAVGSSASKSGGSLASARAIATRWHCPCAQVFRMGVEARANSDGLEQFAGTCPRRPCRDSTQGHRHANILQRGQPADKMKPLENEADAVPSQQRSLLRPQPGQVLAEQFHSAAVGGQDAAENREQCRLPAPGRSGKKGAFAAADGQIDVVQNFRRGRGPRL